MRSDRITVSLPPDVRSLAQRMAREHGLSLSDAIAQALAAWVRGNLVDAWLSDYQAEHGHFSEVDLMRLAQETGMPYVPPSPVGGAA